MSKPTSIPGLNERRCEIENCTSKVFGNEKLALCHMHAVDAWEIVNQHLAHDMSLSPELRIYTREINRRRLVDHDRETRRREANRSPDAPGEIYFVRLDGLIKVGWSADLYGRLRHYGPTAVLLAHYVASRSEETTLHQQLKPARAKGREWYHDGPILQRFIDEVIAQHGEPTFSQVAWTEH